MDLATFNGAVAVVGTIAGHIWGKLRTAVKAEEAINDQPQLRQEFEAHKAEDQTHHSEIRESLTGILGEVKRMGDNIDWIKRELDRGKNDG